MNQSGLPIDLMSALRGLFPLAAGDGDGVNPALSAPGLQAAAPVLADANGWEHSSLELLTGVEVTDFSETISGEVFFELFRR